MLNWVMNKSQTPTGWIEAIAESDYDLRAGRVVPLATVQADLHKTIEEIESDLASGQPEALRGR